MDEKPDSIVEQTARISRNIGCSYLTIFLVAGLVGTLTESHPLKWLNILLQIVGSIFFALLAIHWLMPGLFILLFMPWLARAWLRGWNPMISATPWDQLSCFEVFLTYLWSIAISGFTVLAIIGWIRMSLQK